LLWFMLFTPIMGDSPPPDGCLRTTPPAFAPAKPKGTACAMECTANALLYSYSSSSFPPMSGPGMKNGVPDLIFGRGSSFPASRASFRAVPGRAYPGYLWCEAVACAAPRVASRLHGLDTGGGAGVTRRLKYAQDKSQTRTARRGRAVWWGGKGLYGC
jgi:hypothetical protein